MKIQTVLGAVVVAIAATCAQAGKPDQTPVPSPTTTVAPTPTPTDGQDQTPTPSSMDPTPAPSSMKPTPSPTPSSTTPSSKAPTPTPESTTPGTEVPTPEPSEMRPSVPGYDEKRGCWWISVEHDATYCVDGPICVGSGDQPAGTNCPKQGAMAVYDCRGFLKSYNGLGDCILPEDSMCQKIHTGAWGCVLPSLHVTPAPSVPTPSPSNNSTNQTDSEDIQFPDQTQKIQLSAEGATSTSSSVAVIGSIGAVAAVGCAVAGTILYKRSKVRTSEVPVTDVLTP